MARSRFSGDSATIAVTINFDRSGHAWEHASCVNVMDTGIQRIIGVDTIHLQMSIAEDPKTMLWGNVLLICLYGGYNIIMS